MVDNFKVQLGDQFGAIQSFFFFLQGELHNKRQTILQTGHR